MGDARRQTPVQSGRPGKIHRPQHLNELLALYSRFPDALLLAGATGATPAGEALQGAERIIDLTTVQELKRIRRTDRFMDIGPALTISRILSTGRHVIPRVLYDALRSVGSPSLRNCATLGGNLALASPYSCPMTALLALESRLELRTTSGSRWLPVSRFAAGHGKTSLRRGEVLTSIRVPLAEWNLGVFKRVCTRGELAAPAVIFCGIGRLAKQEIQDLRFAIGAVNPTGIRDRRIETPLVGQKLPLSGREIDGVCAQLGELIEPVSDPFSTPEYRRITAVRVLRWFIEELNRYPVYSF